MPGEYSKHDGKFFNTSFFRFGEIHDVQARFVVGICHSRIYLSLYGLRSNCALLHTTVINRSSRRLGEVVEIAWHCDL